LFGQVEAATRALPGFSCEVSRTLTTVTRSSTDVAQVTFLRPNFFKVVMKEGGGSRTYTTLSDGQSMFSVMDKTYARISPVSADTADPLVS